MQLIVLGMHRTGTSVLAGLLNLMGAHFGPRELSIGANDENKKGFWERSDVVGLNQETLKSCGADWFRVANLDPGTQADQKRFRKEALPILKDLNKHQPWVMKDPRLCLLFPLWNELLESPVCLHTYRSPIETAGSLQVRNGFPINAGIALWEKYNLDALQASRNLPRLLIHYKDLLESPVEVVARLYNELCSLGVQGLNMPEAAEIRAFVDPGLYRSRIGDSVQPGYLNCQQNELNIAFENGSILSWPSLPSLSAGAFENLTILEATDTIKTRNMQLENRVEELDVLLLAKKGRNLQLEERVEKLDVLLLAQNGHSLQLEERIEKLDALLLAQNGHSLQLEERIKALDASQLTLTGRNRQLEDRVEELDALLLARFGRNLQLDERIQQLDREKEELNCMTELQNKQMEMDRIQIAELNDSLRNLQIERNNLYNSTSWKIGHALVKLAGKLTLRKFRSNLVRNAEH